MGIESWSITAASNNSASPNGAPEGMPPSGVNDTIRQIMASVRSWFEGAEWINYGYTHTYASGTSFTIASTDVTGTYSVGRRVRAVGSSTGTIYGTITASSFSTNTTVTVSWDSGSLSSESLTVSLGIIKGGSSAKSTAFAATNAINAFSTTQSMSGAAFNFAAEADVASAAAIDLGAVASNNVRITASTVTTITTFGTASAGITRDVRIGGAMTLTHNGTSLILPSGANITAAANDTLKALSLGSGNWIVTSYKKQDGKAVVRSGAYGYDVKPAGSSTFTTASDITTSTQFRFTITAGGGGGGAANNGAGSGGGAGSTAIYIVTGLTPSTGYSYTVGAGGSAGSGGAGGTGGTSSITIGSTTVSAPGGTGGAYGNGTAIGNAGSGGGTCTNANVDIPGGGGGAASSSVGSGIGGTSYWGGGGRAVGTANTAGQAGQAPGSGGSGAYNTGAANGGAGADGIMFIEWQG